MSVDNRAEEDDISVEDRAEEDMSVEKRAEGHVSR
jgi:hypothetical protein